LVSNSITNWPILCKVILWRAPQKYAKTRRNWHFLQIARLQGFKKSQKCTMEGMRLIVIKLFFYFWQNVISQKTQHVVWRYLDFIYCYSTNRNCDVCMHDFHLWLGPCLWSGCWVCLWARSALMPPLSWRPSCYDVAFSIKLFE
jgi:hypothetical protein